MLEFVGLVWGAVVVFGGGMEGGGDVWVCEMGGNGLGVWGL